MKIQMQVLQVLLDERRNMNLTELKIKTKLTAGQIYVALRDLYNRKLIAKHRFMQPIGKNSPPSGRITVEAHPNNIQRCMSLVEADLNGQ